MEKKQTLQLVISTMHKNGVEDFAAMKIQTDAVVVNQCEKEGILEFKTGNRKICWVNSATRGLSKSRNIALKNATADIVLLCDDDEELVDEYSNIILSAFAKHPDADIIAFQVEGIEREFKQYSPTTKQLDYLSSLSVSSVEIALKRESVGKNIRFREEFGTGAKYKMGEENIFLYDCLKNGLTLYYEPKCIARLHMDDSSWFDGFNQKYFFDRGAVYYELFGNLKGKLMLLVFAVKNYNRFKNEMSFFKALKYMFEGHKERKREKGRLSDLLEKR